MVNFSNITFITYNNVVEKAVTGCRYHISISLNECSVFLSLYFSFSDNKPEHLVPASCRFKGQPVYLTLYR